MFKKKNDSLSNYIETVGTIGQAEYQKIAELFEEKVLEEISLIWKKHKKKLLMKLQGVKLCTEGSTVNSSTAIGYIVEEFIVKQLPKEYGKMDGSTTNAVADFYWNDKSKVELYVNLKVDKSGKSNNAICAPNKLINLYGGNKKPKLMLIFKIIYSINEQKSTLNIEDFKTVFLESFIMEYRVKVSKDNRNWSKVHKPESGRLQIPTHKSDAPIKDIPSPDKVNDFVSIELPELLKKN